MKQHSIDLLPEAIRQRNQAGLVTGRYIAAVVIAAIVLVVTSTHSRILTSNANARLVKAEANAKQVRDKEEMADQLRRQLRDAQMFVSDYNRVALPLELSRVLSAIVQALPESVTLTRVDIDAGYRRMSSGPRSKGKPVQNEVPPRMLRAELTGFASSDQEIAQLVAALDGTKPFDRISLDFSRTMPGRSK